MRLLPIQNTKAHKEGVVAAIDLLARIASADRVVTSNGGRFIAKIPEWSDGEVTIATEIAGTFTIDRHESFNDNRTTHNAVLDLG